MTGDDIQTQRVLDLDVIKPLKSLLSSPTETVLKETCWTISNITAGNVNQIQVYLAFGRCIGSGRNMVEFLVLAKFSFRPTLRPNCQKGKFNSLSLTSEVQISIRSSFSEKIFYEKKKFNDLWAHYYSIALLTI